MGMYEDSSAGTCGAEVKSEHTKVCIQELQLKAKIDLN